MRAIILAAGLGSRLRPYSESLPKCLFPLYGRPLLDTLVERLAEQGIRSILLNTHHLAPMVEEHIKRNIWPVPVLFRREEKLLDTGGSIKNMADFFNDKAMLVINGDIDSDIELAPLIEAHYKNKAPATLVLLEGERKRHVAFKDRFIQGFREDKTDKDCHYMTFSGIQLLSPEALSFFNIKPPFSSIEAYRGMITAGQPPYAHILEKDRHWADIGSIESFSETALKKLILSIDKRKNYKLERLAGDGSDRKWQRVSWPDKSVVIADHGIQGLKRPSEAEAYLLLGRHLKEKGLPLPEILAWDIFAGLIAMEDLGDTRLYDTLKKRGYRETKEYYRELIHLFPRMKKAGLGLIPEMSFNFPEYNQELILKRECFYFKEAFLENLLDIRLDKNKEDKLLKAFYHLAEKSMEHNCTGLMHRDFQSRNIMIKEGRPCIIDFQDALKGPLQYDLAALLIDPYADLPEDMQEELLELCSDLMADEEISREEFKKGYYYLALCRNLQIIAAFSFLWKEKKKPFFKDYIKPALKKLIRQRVLKEKELEIIRETAMEALKEFEKRFP